MEGRPGLALESHVNKCMPNNLMIKVAGDMLPPQNIVFIDRDVPIV